MLRKLRNILFVLIIIAGVGYGAYFVLVIPGGFNDKETLIESYFENIESTNICDEHFNSESEIFCLGFTDLLADKTIEITDIIPGGDIYRVVMLVDNDEMEFDVSFIEVEVTGLKSFMNKTYYLIDVII